MGIFTKLYIKTKYWARHEKAPKYLAILSFAESSFFPVPPDVMLGPMCIARPRHSYKYALIAIVFSVLGGIFGYLIGYLSFETIVQPLLTYFGYQESYEVALNWFNKWGLWAVVVSGFTPIPYKIFTIGAGVMQFNLPLFIFGSILGRSARFLLVSTFIRFSGLKIEKLLKNYIDIVGWILIVGLLAIIVIKYI